MRAPPKITLALVAALALAVLAPLAGFGVGETIGGTLVYRTGDEGVPVEGVAITVSLDGQEVGSAAFRF